VGQGSAQQNDLMRILTPVTKLTTGRQCVAVLSEVIESFGGAGYVEDTGLPALLRDAQVLPIWEGTTNVLSLDAMLRADLGAGMAALRARVDAAIHDAPSELGEAAATAVRAVEHAISWATSGPDPRQLQGGARRFALTLGRALELAMMIEHASWAQKNGGQADATALAQRFAQTRIDQIL